jgi:hypothetical protein
MKSVFRFKSNLGRSCFINWSTVHFYKVFLLITTTKSITRIVSLRLFSWPSASDSTTTRSLPTSLGIVLPLQTRISESLLQAGHVTIPFLVAPAFAFIWRFPAKNTVTTDDASKRRASRPRQPLPSGSH